METGRGFGDFMGWVKGKGRQGTCCASKDFMCRFSGTMTLTDRFLHE